LEHLSDASFLDKLLVFPANVGLDWKVIASSNTLAYLASLKVTKEKCFITLAPGVNVIKHFSSSSLPLTPNLVVLLSLTNDPSRV
jgi:hypothetical protein